MVSSVGQDADGFQFLGLLQLFEQQFLFFFGFFPVGYVLGNGEQTRLAVDHDRLVEKQTGGGVAVRFVDLGLVMTTEI